MIQQVFSIFDAKAKAFGQPFFAFNGSVAMRTVAAVARDGQSLVSKFPEDYQLYHIGQFNDETALLEAVSPTVVCAVVSLTERV